MANHSTDEMNGLKEYIIPLKGGQTDLLGRLIIPAGSVRVKSIKWANLLLNWKKFLFDVIPAFIITAIVIPNSVIAAVANGLKAIQAAGVAMEIELTEHASEVIIHIAAKQRSEDSNWIPIDYVLKECEKTGLDAEQVSCILRDLVKLNVLRFDLDDKAVQIIETIAFVPPSK
jgi:hypothetical protein